MISATHANAAVGRRSIDWKRYALAGAATIIAAVVANVLFYYLGQLLVNYDPDFVVLTSPAGAIIFTFFPALAAVLIYGGLLRYAANPDKIFTGVSVVVLAVSIIPDLTYIPGVDGSSSGQTAILILMHVIAAVVIVGMLTQRAEGGPLGSGLGWLDLSKMESPNRRVGVAGTLRQPRSAGFARTTASGWAGNVTVRVKDA